ncbi:hypothetical protein OUZ56_010935 [Daphnia magna]|uniref:Uncharacterized protein n=1 Tax=Daphnia magna TaxID=35525 RepID=A0ABQ9YYV3_9CRUS|nr:hypothetical protein OUZ56_010935 [Daphnia magna]
MEKIPGATPKSRLVGNTGSQVVRSSTLRYRFPKLPSRRCQIGCLVNKSVVEERNEVAVVPKQTEHISSNIRKENYDIVGEHEDIALGSVVTEVHDVVGVISGPKKLSLPKEGDSETELGPVLVSESH